MSFLRVLVSLGRVFHRLFRKLVAGPVILFIEVRRGDKVGMFGKIVELGGPLVPVVSASPASGGCFAHVSLLYETMLNCITPILLAPYRLHSWSGAVKFLAGR